MQLVIAEKPSVARNIAKVLHATNVKDGYLEGKEYLVLLGLAIGQAEWETAAYYLFPISAYMAGAFISELLPNPVKYHLKIRWDTLLIAVEMATVLVLGLVPESAPVQISQVAVNFIASMQYNTFRQAEGTPMATTFATNHIRQVGVGLAKEIQHFRKKDKKHREKWGKH